MVIKPDKETYHFKKAGQKKVHVSLRLLDLDPLLGERRNRGAFTHYKRAPLWSRF
jgi:hypothetical protein